MELIFRLSGLVGHNVCINTNVGKGNNNTNEGVLEEVGGNIIAIRPSHSAKEPSEAEEQLSIKLDAASIAHARGYCRVCDAKSTTRPVV